MSLTYSSNPVADWDNYCDFCDELDAEKQARTAWIVTDFTKEFLTKRMSDTSTFGEHFNAYAGQGKGYVMRRETVGEVAYNSVDGYKGPNFDTVFEFVAAEANKGNQAALDLVAKMASEYARMKVDK